MSTLTNSGSFRAWTRILILAALPALFLNGCLAIRSLEDSGLFGEKKQDTTPVTAAGLAAIGGSGSPGPGTPAGGGAAGPSGTVIDSSDNMLRIIIPEGAMHDQQKFTITRYTAATSALPGGFIPTTPVYQITPSYRFKKDVTLIVTMDTSRITSLNLRKARSAGFALTKTSADDNSAVLNGWGARDSSVEGDKLVMKTRTFSLFGGASPPAGNAPPNILGAFYYFKPNTTYLPHRVRARIVEPDGDTMQVYLITGPVGGGTNVIAMTPDGGNWYRADIPYEAMVAAGIQMQILAVDQYGNNTTRPTTNIFQYPADSGNNTYINNYTRDQDGDGYLDAWEIDNGFDPRNPADPPAASHPDTDGDGIPDASDHTPNGEPNPQIDGLNIVPSNVQMDVSETVGFGVQATFGGQPRFVNPSFATTGNALNGSPVGAVTGGLFQANHPGVAGVTAIVGPMNAVASVTVADSVGPNGISDLTATASSANVVRLRWTAPGNDGSAGRASAYEVRRSTAVISDDASCNAAPPIAHALVPKNAGIVEILDLVGHAAVTTYYYCVRAYDSNGNRNTWSGTVSTTTSAAPDAVPPADITGVTAVPSGTNRMQLNWTAVGDDGMTGSAQAYEIRYATTPINSDGDCDSGIVVPNNVSGAAGTPVGFLVSGLSENTTYFFCVRASDSSGNRSSWNGVLNAATPVANIPPIMSATADPTKMVTLPLTLDGTASVDPDAIGCGANTGNYNIAWTVINKPITSNVTDGSITNANALSASVILDVEGSYTFQLLFTDDAGTCGGGNRAGLTTVTVTALAQDLAAPADVTDLNAVPGGVDNVNLTWTAVGDDGNVGVPTHYEIGISQLPITTDAECIAATDKRFPPTSLPAGSAMNYTVQGLNQNQTYHFCIRAFDEVSQSGTWSGAVLATTLEGTAGWGPWGPWSACSANCAGGTQSRTRNCDNPGLGCLGNNTDSVACNTHVCPVMYVTNRTWGASTSATCPSTHQIEQINCPRGGNRREDFDYWCPICACGIILRWSGWVYTSNTGSNISGNTGYCHWSSGTPVPPAPCQFTSNAYQNTAQARCRLRP